MSHTTIQKSKETRMCEKCQGLGYINTWMRTLPHGRGDEYEWIKCEVCDGQKIVIVSEEIKTTITPLYHKEDINQ